jgi:hypothetical protein
MAGIGSVVCVCLMQLHTLGACSCPDVCFCQSVMSMLVAVSPVRQDRAKDNRNISKAETETKMRRECMRDLKAAAAVLEAAVTTVAAAADRRAPQQPSDRLLTTCWTAVYALTGVWLLSPLHKHVRLADLYTAQIVLAFA